jgi:hypothetical protein
MGIMDEAGQAAAAQPALPPGQDAFSITKT